MLHVRESRHLGAISESWRPTAALIDLSWLFSVSVYNGQYLYAAATNTLAKCSVRPGARRLGAPAQGPEQWTLHASRRSKRGHRGNAYVCQHERCQRPHK